MLLQRSRLRSRWLVASTLVWLSAVGCSPAGSAQTKPGDALIEEFAQTNAKVEQFQVLTRWDTNRLRLGEERVVPVVDHECRRQ